MGLFKNDKSNYITVKSNDPKPIIPKRYKLLWPDIEYSHTELNKNV